MVVGVHPQIVNTGYPTGTLQLAVQTQLLREVLRIHVSHHDTLGNRPAVDVQGLAHVEMHVVADRGKLEGVEIPRQLCGHTLAPVAGEVARGVIGRDVEVVTVRINVAPVIGANNRAGEVLGSEYGVRRTEKLAVDQHTQQAAARLQGDRLAALRVVLGEDGINDAAGRIHYRGGPARLAGDAADLLRGGVAAD